MKTTGTLAFAIGTKTLNKKGNLLECFFPVCHTISSKTTWEKLQTITNISEKSGFQEISASLATQLLDFAKQEESQTFSSSIIEQLNYFYKTKLIITLCDVKSKPLTIADSYLRLHLLSQRVFKPHEIKLTNIFSILPNVAWTSEGAIDITELAEKQWQARLNNKHLHIYSVDKFPPMADYVVPSEVRIGNASRIRLGAYLGKKTTVMHEGFVNFNSGTEGPNMIEGRVSSGVFVKKGADLGGGSSTMGTLSGGGKEIISVGENSLIGANAGLGIPLGKNCIIESGLYLTATSKVTLLNIEQNELQVVKAKDLANQNNLLFRRNSTSGAIECLSNKTTVELNETLHNN